jgi:hypothetical protein
VDVLVKVTSRIAYYGIESRMREQGFSQDPASKVICRWFRLDLAVDVMPDDPAILGFSNQWYRSARQSARLIELSSGIQIHVLDGPHLLATKFSAFADRGRGDLYASHDFEDVVSLVNGRVEIVEELTGSTAELRDFVAKVVRDLLLQSEFPGAVEGHLGSTEDARGRHAIVLERFKTISGL